MKNYLKQFTEWGTALKLKSKYNMFEDARLELTFFYVVTMVIIMGIFSIALLNSIERNFRKPFLERSLLLELHDVPYHNPVDDVKALILYTDGLLLIVITVSGYILAGRTLKPIKDALESQKRFSADASHDLRTPLSIITTESEVLLQSNSKNIEEYRKVIESNLQEAQRMSLLANDLLLIARSEDGVVPGNFTKTNIKDFINKLIPKISNQAKEKDISLNILNNNKTEIRIHEHSFERAIQNILQNALKYTNNGGAIHVETQEDKSRLTIKIKDTGVGISKADLPKVFDRFYKGLLSRGDSGFGLGLPIARQIVENHHGKIVVESREGVGTSVSIIIPKG